MFSAKKIVIKKNTFFWLEVLKILKKPDHTFQKNLNRWSRQIFYEYFVQVFFPRQNEKNRIRLRTFKASPGNKTLGVQKWPQWEEGGEFFRVCIGIYINVYEIFTVMYGEHLPPTFIYTTVINKGRFLLGCLYRRPIYEQL